MIEIISLILAVPTVLELWNDSEGDFNKGADVFVRMFFMAAVSFVIKFTIGIHPAKAFLLSASFFFLTFDYAIAYILIKKGTIEPPRGVRYHWFTYVAKVGVVDNISFWRKMNPWLKLGVRLFVFITALITYLNE